MAVIKATINEQVAVYDFDGKPAPSRWDPHGWQVAVHIQKPTFRNSVYIQITPTPERFIESVSR